MNGVKDFLIGLRYPRSCAYRLIAESALCLQIIQTPFAMEVPRNTMSNGHDSFSFRLIWIRLTITDSADDTP